MYMDKNMNKRRRIYSVEPSKVACATLARKYVNYLLPALVKIGMTASKDENDVCKMEKMVRHEVDMALVLSTEGFAWSHALKQKLHQPNVNVGGSQGPSVHHLPSLKCPWTCNAQNVVKDELNRHTLSLPGNQHAVSSMLFSSNPNQKAKVNELKRPQRPEKLPRKKEEEEIEEEQLSSRLMNLRTLLPGGMEMGVEEMLSEIGSYIVCLELQMSILQCLVEMS